jgi:glycosyltransferase involved in cell wall biosynthesis
MTLPNSADFPFLHVFIPAYGESPYLRAAIVSAIESVDQSTPITVVDDASPTGEVFSITAEFQPRVEYLRNDVNLGISANFLNSFNLSSGLFTLVMGSDDEMLPGYEFELSKSFNSFPNTTVFQPRVLVIDAAGETCTPLVDRVKRMIQGEQLSLASERFVFQKAQTFRYRRHAASVSSVLALESTRLNEELAAHLMAKNLLPKNSGIFIRLLAHLAPTVRIHAMIIGIKQLPMNPINGVRHFLRALGPLRPIKRR